MLLAERAPGDRVRVDGARVGPRARERAEVLGQALLRGVRARAVRGAARLVHLKTTEASDNTNAMAAGRCLRESGTAGKAGEDMSLAISAR